MMIQESLIFYVEHRKLSTFFNPAYLMTLNLYSFTKAQKIHCEPLQQNSYSNTVLTFAKLKPEKSARAAIKHSISREIKRVQETGVLLYSSLRNSFAMKLNVQRFWRLKNFLVGVILESTTKFLLLSHKNVIFIPVIQIKICSMWSFEEQSIKAPKVSYFLDTFIPFQTA